MSFSNAATAEQSNDTYGTLRVGDAYMGLLINNLVEVCPVDKLHPLLVKSEGLLGAMKLRDQLIPVLDPSVICGFARELTKPRFAAVLRHGDKKLAIGIDEVAGLATVAKSAIQPVEGLSEFSGKLAAGVFYQDGNAVTVADVGVIFDQSDVPTVRSESVQNASVMQTNTQPFITFEVGGAFFSVRAIDIYGTVPRQPIDQNALTSGTCLGSIHHHGRRVPVLCSVGLLQLGGKKKYAHPEVLILRFPGERLLGLAVDAIRSIEALGPQHFSDAPPAICARNAYLRKVKIDAGGTQVYDIDVELLRQNEALIEVSTTSSLPAQDDLVDGSIENADGNLEYERRDYLVFEAGQQFATLLQQVVHVMVPPDTIVPLAQPEGGLFGFFSHEGTSVPLIDLVSQVGSNRKEPPAADHEKRVLMVGKTGTRVGFIVEKVTNIGRSVWRHTVPATPKKSAETLLQISIGEQKSTLPVIDLETIAADLDALHIVATEAA